MNGKVVVPMKRGKIKMEKGITLVALIITVVIMIILSGIAIGGTIGNNGIFSKAKYAVNKYDEHSTNIDKELNETAEQMGENADEEVLEKAIVNVKCPSNRTINGKRASANNPIVPEGYTPIDAGEAKWGDGSSKPAQSSVDHGLVIKDDAGNEWVWVPVSTQMIKNMYETSSADIALTGETGATTKMYTKTATIGGEEDKVTVSRTLPNGAEWREPDLESYYDLREEYYKTILGFDTPKAMAEVLVNEYEEMVNSVKKYSGFYIGRYELSNEGVQKGKDTLSNVNWYVLYNKCMKLNASDKVKSRMVWGLQWDLACDFISKKGDKKSIKNSTSWGNYVNAVGNAAVMAGTTKMYGNKQVTGYSEYWKANNIYDLAGNCEEWSQEAGYDRFRAGRGGSCTMDGAELLPASARNKDGSYGYDPNLRNTPSTNNKIGEKYGKSKRRKRNNINRINSYNNNFANISWNNRRRGNKCNT